MSYSAVYRYRDDAQTYSYVFDVANALELGLHVKAMHRENGLAWARLFDPSGRLLKVWVWP